MAKRKTMVDLDDAAVKAILSALLTDFKARDLTAADLHESYEGPALPALKEACLADGGFGKVDYDLAFKSLELANLIKTGPIDVYDNDPNAGFTIIGTYSKEEWVHLTETGYQAAGRVRAVRPVRISAPNVHISGGTFHNSPIGVGHNVAQELNLNTASTEQLIERLRAEVRSKIEDTDRQDAILEKLDELQAAHDKPTRMERYLTLMGAAGDHITVLMFLLTPLFHSLQ